MIVGNYKKISLHRARNVFMGRYGSSGNANQTELIRGMSANSTNSVSPHFNSHYNSENNTVHLSKFNLYNNYLLNKKL